MSTHMFGKPGDTAFSSPSQPALQKKQAVVKHASPEELRPFPKAAAQKSINNHKRVKTLILTDIPVKNQSGRELEAISAKKMKNTSKVPTKRPPVKRTLIKNYEPGSDSESDEE